MDELAVVVLAHGDPAQLHRLVRSLPDLPVVLHVDRRTPAAVHARMVGGLPPRVRLAPRVGARLSSWSLVEAELSGLRTVLATTRTRHVAVLSGADYPLMPVPELARELDAWSGASWLTAVPLPYPAWDTARHRDGGRWRFEHRFLTRRDQLVQVRGVPVRAPWRRPVPAGLELRASSQWKVYARHHAELLLRVVADRPDLVAFARTTFVPDESFAASVLSSPAVVGAEALPVLREHAWHQRWLPGDPHPGALGAADLDGLRRARWAPATGPGARGPVPRPYRKLFARKFTSATSGPVLDAVDAGLAPP